MAEGYNDTWREWLARCRAASNASSRPGTMAELFQFTQQTMWLALADGNIINAARAFMSLTAIFFCNARGNTVFGHPILDYREQEPGNVILFVDPTRRYVIVQAKFGLGSPGAMLDDPERATKKGVLVAPSFEASDSNIKSGTTSVLFCDLVRSAKETGRVEGPLVIQDENRFINKRNIEGVIVLTMQEWVHVINQLPPNHCIVTIQELMEIIEGEPVQGSERKRSEGNEHLLQVAGVLLMTLRKQPDHSLLGYF